MVQLSFHHEVRLRRRQCLTYLVSDYSPRLQVKQKDVCWCMICCVAACLTWHFPGALCDKSYKFNEAISID